MATVRSSTRLLRLLQLLVFCFAVVSWSSSLFLSLPLPSSLANEYKQYNKVKPSPLELVNARNSSQYVARSLVDDLILERRHIDPTFERTWPELSFIQRLQLDRTQGHNTTSLSQLSFNVNSTGTSTITALIHATDRKSLQIQLDALTDQTMTIDTTWIVCSEDLRAVAEIYAAKYRSLEVTVLVMDIDTTAYPEKSAGATPWLSLLPRVHTDYVWIIEDGVKPSSDYLKTTFGLLQTDEYKNTLLGSHASLLPPSNDLFDSTISRPQLHCLPAAFHLLPKLTRPVDMIHHTWLLRVEWIPSLLTERRLDALESPLSYYISQSLLMHANIPSVVIPPAIISSTNDADTSSPLLYLQNIKPSVSCTTTIPSAYQQSKHWNRLLTMNSSPTVLDYRYFSQSTQPAKALFFIDGPREANAFLPLICQFEGSSSEGLSIHVLVTGKQRGLSGSSISALIHHMSDCHSTIKVHDLDHFTLLNPMDTANHISLQLSRWIQALQPKIIFHSRHDLPLFHSVATLVQSYHLPVIQLPTDDVQHALWLAKLPLAALQCWNQIKIDLVVITDRRPHSLSRLFNSIGHGVYLGDQVDLTIHMEQTSDRVTRMFVNSFSWLQGIKRLRHRVRKGGLMPAIVESWYPSSNDNYGVILEDDIEVSPLFYTWIKYNILHYRYSKRDMGYDRIYGISLYSPRNLELLPEGRIEFDPNDVLLPSDFSPRTPYASQVPCSWGAVYFPEHWREFHHYLTTRLMDIRHSQRLHIHVPNSRSERWKKSWKKYFIEMVYLRAYVMVYPNFQAFESFSTNHLEFGTHIKHERAQVALDSFVVPLMQRNTILSQLPDHRLPRFDELPMMDLWGDLMTHDEMEKVAATWHQAVSMCARWPSNHFNPQDMLCPFDDVDSVDSLDVAAMTTSEIDYEHLDDQVKDLESDWGHLRILSSQQQQLA